MLREIRAYQAENFMMEAALEKKSLESLANGRRVKVSAFSSTITFAACWVCAGFGRRGGDKDHKIGELLQLRLLPTVVMDVRRVKV